MRRRGIVNRNRLVVALDDKRSPMARLLQDCVHRDGSVQVNYEQQFKTLFKAQRLGYVDPRGFITERGKQFLVRSFA